MATGHGARDSGRRDRLARAARAEPRARHLARPEELVDRIRSFAIVRLHFDGSASVLSGTSDMGQGARTVLTQIAAEELGIAPDRIAIVMGDTAVVPFDSSTSASRSTVFMGNAVVEACDTSRSSCGRWPRPIPRPAGCRPPTS